MLNHDTNLKTTTLSAPYKNQLGSHQYDPLTKAEEQKLLKRYKKTHDIDARNKLIKSNLRYAQTLIKPWIGRGLDYSELASEANCGLIESIDKFNPNFDIKLNSYAKWWIIERMRSAVEKQNQMKMMELPEDDDPTDKDRVYDNVVAEYTKYDFPLQLIYRADSVAEKEEEERREKKIKSFLDEITTSLTDREKGILNDYFGCGGNDALTLVEVGEKYGICKERVRQILEKTMRKLRSEAVLSDTDPSNLLS